MLSHRTQDIVLNALFIALKAQPPRKLIEAKNKKISVKNQR